MKTISKYAISAAVLLSVASGLAFAQENNTQPAPATSQQTDASPNAAADARDQDCGDGMNWRRHGHGKGHGRMGDHGMMGDMGRGGPGGGRMMMMIDANGDGFIGPDEAASLADGMFMRLDQNRDNVIDEAEATSGVTSGRGNHGWRSWFGGAAPADVTAKLKAAFVERDADKDGKVTKLEFMTFAQNKYAALDTAKDGKVSPWAFRAQPKL